MMNNSTNIHWSEDPELLERFVLRRLEPAKRAELETHLRVCVICQRAVRAEQELVAGVRRLGRDELKARLKQRLESARSEEIRVRVSRPVWTWQIASAAAIIILLIGIGIYDRWFTFHEEKQMEGPSQLGEIKNRSSADDKEVPEAGKDENKSRIAAETRPTTPAKTMTPTVVDRAHRRRDEAPTSNEREGDKFADKKPAEETPVPAANAAGAGAAELREQSNLDQRRPQSEESAGTQTLWIEGTLLKGSRSAAAKQAEQFNKAKVAADASQSRRYILRQNGNAQTLTLHQQLNDALPPSRKLRQTQLQGKKVQTLVERTEQGLAMTLYLDKPLDESELQEATIQPISPDSLIVNLKNQQIGYRIPGGWSGLGTIKTKIK